MITLGGFGPVLLTGCIPVGYIFCEGMSRGLDDFRIFFPADRASVFLLSGFRTGRLSGNYTVIPAMFVRL